MRLELYLTPFAAEKSQLAGSTVAVIDVLRATTTVCFALRAGCNGVIPCEGPSQAAQLRRELGHKCTVLAGERNGMKIEGYDLGNSPQEFTEKTVAEKIVLLTTTNGTPIFSKINTAQFVVGCAFVNVSAVATRLAQRAERLLIVCAGNNGGFSLEDCLCGGLLIEKVRNLTDGNLRLNDAAKLSLLLYQSKEDCLEKEITEGEHGTYLSQLGFANDIRLAAMIDSIPLVPVLSNGRLVCES